ncbi:glutamine synthetase beta-grasp domain-containing protein [Dehalococcoidia bacterium]|nr:glutamine synthetase beta-grasp domain-containing protein [Dehalococcoidia bacterium]
MVYKAEYLWLDGTKPSAQIRSKTKVIADGEAPPIWGFDGSSTQQAAGESSDVVLNPVHVVPDPIRGGNNVIVMNETLLPDMSPHPTNTRAACAAAAEKFGSFDMWFGIEQEYTFFQGRDPLGWPEDGFPAPQGDYYCAVGSENIFGRDIVEEHMDACIAAGLTIAGINAEVMPGQWEYQIGPVGAPQVADELWIGRWLLARIAENYGVTVSLDAKPVKGDWNGAGCHTNFSTKQMRENYAACVAAAEALGTKAAEHIANYGSGIEDRLTGQHETASYKDFSYGVSDRGASIRIPWQVARDQKGYIEDRRPNANMDPYVVTGLVIDTVCGAASK